MSATRAAELDRAHPPRSFELADTLRDDILAGRIAAGERLPPERQLALRLGVGRSTVREALRRLEQLGLVTIVHGGGATVQPLEDASLDILSSLLVADGQVRADVLDQVLEVYGVVMTAAVGFAIERASDAERERARELLRRLQRRDLGDADTFAALEELIQLMSVASRNLVLRLVRNGLKSLFAPAPGDGRHGRFRPPPSVLAPVARELERALDARDVAAARAGVRRLLVVARDRIHARLATRAAS